MSRRKKEAEAEVKEWVRVSVMRQRGGYGGGGGQIGGPSCGSSRDVRGGGGCTIGQQ